VPIPERPREPHAPEPDLLAELETEAGIEIAVDPSPRTGDLKSEVESFTTLDACVKARAPIDPLLGDAIEALGYDTLTRDSCRILQALSSRSVDACKPISSSQLRARCESQVAIVLGDPNLCPVNGGGGSLVTREPVCLARANRDERLCTAAGIVERARCKALVLGQTGACGRDASCVRDVERYRSLLEKPVSHPDVPAHMRVEIAAEPGTPEPNVRSFDLDDVAATGVVIGVSRGKTRLALGAPLTAAWLPPDSPAAVPRAFFEVAVPSGGDAGQALAATDVRLDLSLPRVGLFSALMANESKVDVEQLSVAPGGRVKLAFTAVLRDVPRAFRVKLDIETFVRKQSGRSAP